MILSPIASLFLTDAQREPLLGRRGPSSPAYHRAAPPCRHSRRRGTFGALEIGKLTSIDAEERGEHDGALGCHGDPAVVEFFGGEASALTVESLTHGPPVSLSLSLSLSLFLFLADFSATL